MEWVKSIYYQDIPTSFNVLAQVAPGGGGVMQWWGITGSGHPHLDGQVGHHLRS